jgi:hypothetical protein
MKAVEWIAPFIIDAAGLYHTLMNILRKMDTGTAQISRKCDFM